MLFRSEAAKLGGPVLTQFGAEKNGNADGTIPPYTGGLTKAPSNYKPGSGKWPDPFPMDKVLFSINAQNMDKYADKLTEGTKSFMKKYPSFRIDIYQTRRSVAYPQWVLDNTLKISTTASTYKGGLALKGAWGGIPFPIPKDAYEVMWNHLLRYEGRAGEFWSNTHTIDSNGRASLGGATYCWTELPYYDMKKVNSEFTYQLRCHWQAPARISGDLYHITDPLNPAEKPRKSWQYLPGLRRVKLAPELAFDTPNPGGGGIILIDDLFNFGGSMERYNWKLIGKKEMYVPYNDYKINLVTAEQLFQPRHYNPDFVRWELHRVWIVEASLRPGKRHVYHKRRFYVDEDSWGCLAVENYDAHGNMYKYGLTFQTPMYEYPCPVLSGQFFADLISQSYSANPWEGDIKGYRGFWKLTEPKDDKFWSPQGMLAEGIR